MTLSRPVSTLLWLCAFLCSLYFVNEWQHELFTAAVFLVCGWAWWQAGQCVAEGLSIPKSWFLGIASLFWLLVFCSIFWSELPFVSLTAFCFFSAMPLTLFGFVLNPDDRQFRQIAGVLAGVLAGLSVWAVIQYCIRFDPFNGQAHHPLADPNVLAALFNLGLVPAIGWMLLAPGKKQSVLALGLAILLFAGLFATGSRGAIFSLVPAFGVMAFCGWPFVRRHVKCLAIVAAAAAILFVLGDIVVNNANSAANRMVETLTLTAEDVSNNRLNLWEGAAGLIRDHWLTGTGFGTFFLYYPEYRSPQELVGASHAHSDPLQYWAELGLLGPVLFYALLIAACVRTGKALKALTAEDPRRIAILAPFCALGAVVVQAHVTFNFYNIVILFGSGFLMAFWFVETGRVLRDGRYTAVFPQTLTPSARRLMLALPLLPVLALFGAYMMSDHFVSKARDSLFVHSDLQQFAAHLQTAHFFDRGLNFRTWLLAANIPMGILQDGGAALPPEQQKELYGQAEGQLARARALNPRSATVRYYQAHLQELVPAAVAPGTKPPEELYREALALDPLHLGSRLALADIYEKRGEKDRAVALLEDGLEYRYGTSRAMEYYGKMLLIYIQAGDQEKRQAMLQKMARLKQRMDISKAYGAKPAPVAMPGADDPAP